MIKNFNTIIKKINLLLEPELSILNNLIKERLSTDVNLIYKISNYISQNRGKMIRPILTILSSKLFNVDQTNTIKLAAAIELIHTATLLHDDVIDESNLRRGKPTANNLWGNKPVILVGDYLFSKAFQLMVETNSLEVLNILSKSSATISKGEIVHLENLANINLNFNNYLDIISAKTACLFEASTYSSAIISTKNVKLINSLKNIGFNIGIAFQIVDDTNDYIANKVKNGKNVGDDFYEGKVTLPLILTLQKATKDELEFFKEVISKNKREEQDFNKAFEYITKYNALEESKNIAKTYIEKALIECQTLEESEYKNVLVELINSIVS